MGMESLGRVPRKLPSKIEVSGVPGQTIVGGLNELGQRILLGRKLSCLADCR